MALLIQEPFQSAENVDNFVASTGVGPFRAVI